MRTATFVIAGVVLVLARPVLAWNGFGHMVIAAAAYEKLTPAAKARAASLLKRNPQYGDWIAGAPADQRDQVAFVVAATWADWIKRDPGHTADGLGNGEHPDPSHAAEARQNIGYADTLQHRYWHFVDRPFSRDHTPTHPPDFVNAQTEIATLEAALADPAETEDIKSYDLVWLLHLVGDVHQPLHCVSRFDRAQPDGDQGGNLVLLSSASTPDQIKLHFLWDSLLGTENENYGAAIAEATKLEPAPAPLGRIADENVWIRESFEAARSAVYVPPVGPEGGPYRLTASYERHARALAVKRAALAGARLAHLLNGVLK